MRRERLLVGCRSGTASALRSCALLAVLAATIAAIALNFVVAAQASRLRSASPELYFGLTYPDTPDITALTSYETQIGKGASLVLWYQPWEENGIPILFPTDQMTAIRQHGSIPVLAWEPSPYPSASSEPLYSLAEITSGAWDPFIRQFASAAKAWGHPFFLRFASEMNGQWTLWSEQANGNTAGQFVKAWRYVHDIFSSVGATNVTWVWSPNTEGFGTTPLQELYPGDAYVDWAGMDGYNFGSDLSVGAPWRTFSDIFSATYADLLHILPPTMPIMIGETGAVEDGGSKSDWIQDALTVQLPANYPRVKALIWFNIAKGGFNLRVDTTPQSLAAFRSAIALSTYQSNRYAQVYQSPIPSPEEIVVQPDAPGAPSVSTPNATQQAPTSLPMPTFQIMLDGPAPASIQLVDAARGSPLVGADLIFDSGPTERTDATGTAYLPPRMLATTLLTITYGSILIYTGLDVNTQHGYQLQIDPATGRIARVLINVVELVIPSALQVSLLVTLGLYFGCRVTLGRRRRVGVSGRRPSYRSTRSSPRPVAPRRRVS